MQFDNGRTFRFAVAIILLLVSPLILLGQDKNEENRSVNNSLLAEEVTLDTGSGKLYGTLLLPASKLPFSVVLIVAGSGQTDRDGNSEGLKGKSDSLRLLAEGLARMGIASLRYDKRGVAKSVAARAAKNLFEVQVNDAALWIGWLNKDSRFNSIGILGHSEGSLIAILAAQNGGVRALVSLAGAAQPMDEVLIEQIGGAIQEGKMQKSVLPAFKSALAELRAGRTVDSRPKDIPGWMWDGLFAPRAQEYLMSEFHYDPVAEITKLPKLGIQVLVVRGTTDLTGRLEHATTLATAAGVRPVIIESMNHELRTAPLERKANDAATEDPKLPLAPGLLEKIVPFLTDSLRVETH